MDIVTCVLRKAREIITPEDRWTKGVLARDSQGRSVSADSKDAVCFCAMGAIDKAAFQQYRTSAHLSFMEVGDTASDAISVLGEEVGTRTVNVWNDDPNTTHEDVLEMFDRTIKSRGIYRRIRNDETASQNGGNRDPQEGA